MRTVCKTNKCVGCHACEELCPKNAIRIEDHAEYMNAVIDEASCIDAPREKKKPSEVFRGLPSDSWKVYRWLGRSHY